MCQAELAIFSYCGASFLLFPTHFGGISRISNFVHVWSELLRVNCVRWVA